MHDDLEPLADGRSLAGVSIHNGFPNPAGDHLGERNGLALDLNQLLIRHPSSTYLFRVRGNNWIEQGVFDGDVAIIDRALTASQQDLILTWQDEQFTICRRSRLAKHCQVWGVINAIIHLRQP